MLGIWFQLKLTLSDLSLSTAKAHLLLPSWALLFKTKVDRRSCQRLCPPWDAGLCAPGTVFHVSMPRPAELPQQRKKKMAFTLTSLPNTPQGLWAESESISVFLRPCLSPFSSLHLDLRINNPECKGKLLLHRWKEPRFLARACLTQTASMMYLIRVEGSFL